MNNDSRISLIVAMTPQCVIGRDGDLPWHLPADLKRFKAITMDKPIVMGRKTYESIGRPLPGRHNIVVTRSKDYQPDGVSAVHSLAQALQVAGDAPEIMVIGGAQLYEAALPLAHRLYITVVEKEFTGDTYFPELDWSQWHPVERSATQLHLGIPFFFSLWERQ